MGQNTTGTCGNALRMVFAVLAILALPCLTAVAAIVNVDSTAASATTVAEKAIPAGGYHRVVAFSPAITEIIYGLGGQDRLVGIAKFSDYPPQAMKEKTIVGGILDVDKERIVALRPDILISPPGAMAGEKLSRLGVEVAFVPDKTLDSVAKSFVTIGRIVGQEAAGRLLERRFRDAIAEVRKRHEGQTPVRALVVIGYEPLWVAGGQGSVNELLETAGGVNAVGGVKRDFYAIDIESVVAARPDVIIDLTLRDIDPATRREPTKAFWKRFQSIPAVRNDRIEFVDIDVLTIPGPRLIDGLKALEKALQPSPKAKSESALGH